MVSWTAVAERPGCTPTCVGACVCVCVCGALGVCLRTKRTEVLPMWLRVSGGAGPSGPGGRGGRGRGVWASICEPAAGRGCVCVCLCLAGRVCPCVPGNHSGVAGPARRGWEGVHWEGPHVGVMAHVQTGVERSVSSRGADTGVHSHMEVQVGGCVVCLCLLRWGVVNPASVWGGVWHLCPGCSGHGPDAVPLSFSPPGGASEGPVATLAFALLGHAPNLTPLLPMWIFWTCEVPTRGRAPPAPGLPTLDGVGHVLLLFFFFKLYLFWPCWVFVVACGLRIAATSLVAEHRL